MKKNFRGKRIAHFSLSLYEDKSTSSRMDVPKDKETLDLMIKQIQSYLNEFHEDYKELILKSKTERKR